MGKLLKNGSHGAEVIAVQRELKKRVAHHLHVSGHYDNKTEQAVRLFQQSVGFVGKDVDGVVGSKTFTALFPVFRTNFTAHLIPQLRRPEIDMETHASSASTGKGSLRMRPETQPTPSVQPATAPPATPADPASDKGQWVQANVQGGPQYSPRDGAGLQIAGTLTLRLPNYPHKIGKCTTHAEVQASLQLGLPLPPSFIYTGQVNLTFQPVSDCWVVHDKPRQALHLPERYQFHFMNGFANVFYQDRLPGQRTFGTSDPSSRARAGGSLGANFIQLDVGHSNISLVLAGQLSMYRDLLNHHSYADAQFTTYMQVALGSWLNHK